MNQIKSCEKDCETIADEKITNREMESLKKLVGKVTFKKLQDIKRQIDNPEERSDGPRLLLLLLIKAALASLFSQIKTHPK